MKILGDGRVINFPKLVLLIIPSRHGFFCNHYKEESMVQIEGFFLSTGINLNFETQQHELNRPCLGINSSYWCYRVVRAIYSFEILDLGS